MSTLFISDLHLCPDRPEIINLFLSFLKQNKNKIDALYILGDLLEYWIGDEAVDKPENLNLIAGLRKFSSMTPLFVMHGNRDFLLGKGFATSTGCSLLPDDPTVIELYGQPVLLMHGDLLCTDDTDYMAFRKMVRDPAWQQAALAKTVEQREQLSRQYREFSKTAMADKKPEIMDVNQQTVEQTMRQYNVNFLIHGHTHRPGRHEFQLDGKSVIRTVLGDWYEQGSVLICDEKNCHLTTLAIGH